MDQMGVGQDVEQTEGSGSVTDEIILSCLHRNTDNHHFVYTLESEVFTKKILDISF